MMIFQNILTTIGQQKRAAAEAGGAALNITYFKVGDSNGQYYEPSETQTDLVNTKYTANFTGQSQILVNPTSPNEVLYKCFIPADVGGFTIRELGLFDSDNDLILICKLPAQEKFTVAEGLYQPLTLTPKMIFTNPQTQVILTVSSQIIATQNFVSEQISDLIGGHTTDPDAHLEKFEVIEDEIETHKADKFIHGDHLPLFTPLTVPKILVGDEAIGWGLQGTSHTRAVYETAYNALETALNNGTTTTDTILISNINSVNVTKIVNCKLHNGMRVVNMANIAQVNDLYTATGSQPYFVIDTTNETFMLPKNENAIRFTTDTTKGSLYNKDQIVNMQGVVNIPQNGIGYTGVFYSYASAGYHNSSGGSLGTTVDFDSSRSVNTGLQVQGRSVNHFLYYKIGNIITNEALIDIGNIQAEIDLKADKDLGNIDGTNAKVNLNNAGIRTVIETYRNGSSWYRKWSDGWIEQGFKYTVPQAYTNINFPTAFTTTDYIVLTGDSYSSAYAANCVAIYTHTTTYIQCYGVNAGVADFYCCGF